jgi:inner membrane transporter RhtA
MQRVMTGWRDAAGRLPVTLWLIADVIGAQLAAAVMVPLIHRFGSMPTTGLRMIWAAFFLLLVARPRFAGLGGRRLLAAIVLGVTTASMTFCFYAAVGRIPIGMVVSIEFLGPLTLAIAGSRRLLDLIWAVLAGFGVWLLTRQTGGVAVDLLGCGLALASAVCWASYILLTRRVGRVFTGMQGLTLSFCVAALVSLPVGILPFWGSIGWLPILFIGATALLSPVVTYSLEMATLRRMEPRRFGIMMSLQPGVAALTGLVVLGQWLSLGQVAGTGCVVLASLGTVAVRPKKR